MNSNYNAASFLLSNIQLKDAVGVGSAFGTGTNEIPMRINQYSLSGSDYSFNNLPLIYCKLESAKLKAIPFVDILQDKYLTLIKSLNNLRVCELLLKLSNIQYKSLNINEMIYIKQIGKYFYPITGDYNPENGILTLKAFTLSALIDNVTIQTIPLEQSALSVASSAASNAANTYALVVSDYQALSQKKTDIEANKTSDSYYPTTKAVYTYGETKNKLIYREVVTLVAEDWSAKAQAITVTGKTVTWGGFTTGNHADTLTVGEKQIALDSIDSATNSTFNFKCTTTPTEDIEIVIEYTL